MRSALIAVVAAATMTVGSGCCRYWATLPGEYKHNPSFSQCCESPWGFKDPFAEEDRRRGRHAKLWGRGAYAGHQGQHDDQGYGYGGQGFAGHPAYGPGGMPPYQYPPAGSAGMMGDYSGGPYSPEGIPLEAAPNAMSAAQVAYPYYTHKGPRDFFLGYPPGTQPPSIGP